jgi:hypothetical protein
MIFYSATKQEVSNKGALQDFLAGYSSEDSWGDVCAGIIKQLLKGSFASTKRQQNQMPDVFGSAPKTWDVSRSAT